MQLPESGAAVLPWVIRGYIFARKNYPGAAVDWMAANRAPSAAIRIVKAGVPASGTYDPDYNSAVSAFIESAKTASAFYRLVTDRAFQVVPLRTRVMITTAPATGVMVGEGVAKPLSAIEWTTVALDPVVKAIALASAARQCGVEGCR